MDLKIIDLTAGISHALDLISPEVVGHHSRTAEIAATLARQLGFTGQDISDLFVAALLHDIGAFSRKARIDALDFETKDIHHAETGWKLLCEVPHMARPARLIRLHHTPWEHIPEDVPPDEALLANVLNLADRVDVAHLSPDLLPRLNRLAGTAFAPRVVNTISPDVLELREKLLSGDNYTWLSRIENRVIPASDVVGFCDAFSHVIDFRSRFTATHSCGVATIARELGRLNGMAEDELRTLKLAGLLHDLGKLAVPSEIIEKPGMLTESEFEIMRGHTLVTEKILGSMEGLGDICLWASQHHERLDGGGYPHGLSSDDLSEGSRIMAVADVFTALTEDRPYRPGMDRHATMQVLEGMVDSGLLDASIIKLLQQQFVPINDLRVLSQEKALSRFKALAA
ncbi:HD domain-containing phosphohydrolase [Desulfovibrio oxyclinae]|uniref:HD domain-containing phosphohydrolase n=1 Tax=Desulfovibrio oxyclinae TaxID=63560 RepID=UPI0003751A8B|nr:HD domain-containing phosphohydrolase [Desulfovibrio oxyclinae]